MFRVLFTLDYEIHGNGDGDPYALMVEPTWRLLRMLEKHNAKLTVFADVAQIIKFKEYFENSEVDRFSFLKIKEQLEYCIANGHDVQLHIHSSFFNSTFNGKGWVQSWDQYNLAALDFEVIDNYIRMGKCFLESMLKPIRQNYTCNVFRAANWSMQPSRNILTSLHKNGFKIDSSVYKWGKQHGNASYDYSEAYSHFLPYPVSFDNVNYLDKDSPIIEMPIYCELKGILSFITPIRIFRATRALFHKHYKNYSDLTYATKEKKKDNRVIRIAKLLFKKHPRKLDFNQLSSSQQISVLKRIKKKFKNEKDIPIVFIGHSKTFIKSNESILYKTLTFLSQQADFEFSTFQEIDLDLYK